jgi:uncharacterized protein (TIGR02268 family)
MIYRAYLLSLFVLGAAPAPSARTAQKPAPAPAAAQPKPAPKRKLLRRQLAITDATINTVPEIFVAGGVPTTLSFRQPINEKSIVLADSADVFLPVRSTSTSIQLIPKMDVPDGSPTTLTVSLADGTVLPFMLGSVPQEADVQLDIDVTLEKKASGDSPQALKSAIGQLRAQLDECTATSDAAGLSKLAALILREDTGKPQPFERHDVHKLDKQSRLLVEVKQAYRLFGHTYVLLTVENRDPSKSWVLDRPEVSLLGDGTTNDLKVAAFSSDTATLNPDETQKLVVAFPTPPQGVNQRFTLSLFEKNGNRHVRLDNVSL